MSGGGGRGPTVHVLRDAKEPHLVLIASPELNSQAPFSEVALRRLHDIEPAFASVTRESDWRPVKGNKNWKTKVQYAVLDEIDARKLAEGGTVIEAVEKEVRERLQQKALMAKVLGQVDRPGDGAVHD